MCPNKITSSYSHPPDYPCCEMQPPPALTAQSRIDVDEGRVRKGRISAPLLKRTEWGGGMENLFLCPCSKQCESADTRREFTAPLSLERVSQKLQG